ncbi:ImmA/IrrE family metallo-endopeptidase [Candidatus Pacearchaeota archaeon]|nr:ImmA/IrrE family metallo-endopeptidase [Candidatus Pacearchaeota archaeon]
MKSHMVLEKIFNYNMLKLARELYGITQTKLSQELNISQSNLSKYESGLIKPGEGEVKKIAHFLDFPNNFFYEPGWAYPPITPFHRKRVSISKKYLLMAEAIGNIQRIQLKKLVSQIEMPENLIHYDPEDFSNGAVGVAKAVRSFYRLPKGPIGNMTDLLEDNGIIVSLIDLFSDKIDGYTLLGDGKESPIIFVNNQFPGDKIRLTLAHEFGHIIMHHVQDEKVEEEAWTFAGEFLMPADEITQELRGVRNIRQLVPLKMKWKVSIAALIMRASVLGVVPERTIRYLYQQMGPYRKVEPIQVEIERPGLIAEILKYYKNDYEYSDQELMTFLAVNNNLFKELYHSQKSRLKLVRG